jgi:hypothetical protein
MPKSKEVPAQDENELEDETSVEETQEENEEGAESETDTEPKDGEEAPAEDEDAGDESDDDTSKKDEEKPETKKRPVYKMPVSKAQDEKKKAVAQAREDAKAEARAEAEAEFQAKFDSMKKEYESKAEKGQSTSALDDRLRKFATDKGVDPEVATGLMAIFKESIQLPDLSRYDKLVEKQEIENHKAEVSREFDEQVIPLIKKDFPSASESHIKKVKQQIEQLAFSKRFNTYAISDIYMVNRAKFEYKHGHSGEDSGGRSGNDGSSLADMSEEEASKLSPLKYTEWMDLQASKQSRYVDVK